jgi:hypothetical protein
MHERTLIKNFHSHMSKAENEEISKELANYKKEMEFAKLKAEAKRKEILNMMLDNMKKEKERNH